MKLKCFIASAFGKKDVDRIYGRAILPVARSLDIIPRRVDRVEHNQDIDDKIIALMSDSDICIADLSYARPSVYYEAGHMTGADKPVIYICRKDHFQSHPKDINGNLRVHFDLQMKNIIPWTGPTASFKKRLSSRLRHVTNPILRKYALKSKSNRAQDNFRSMSNNEKLDKLWKNAFKILMSRRFSVLSARQPVLFAHNVCTVGIKKIKRLLDVVIVAPALNITKKDIDDVRMLIWRLKNITLPTNHNLDHGHIRVIHLFLCTIRPLPFNRIEEAFSHFKPFPDEHRLIGSLDKSQNHWKHDILDIHVVDRIMSKEDFAQRLAVALEYADKDARSWSKE